MPAVRTRDERSFVVVTSYAGEDRACVVDEPARTKRRFAVIALEPI